MIHKTAIIDSKAKIASNVKIGPYCVIGPNVEIGENTIIQSHVNISVNAKIGKGNNIYPFVSINNPQDLKYNGELTKLVIGDNNKIREYESTIKWVIEHYPFDKISNIFDITQEISDLNLPEEELEKVFDEYLMKNYELKEGKKYLKYTQDEYERIEKNKFNLKKDLEEQGYSSSHLD